MGKGKPLFEILQEQKAEQGGQLKFSMPTKKQPQPQREARPADQAQRLRDEAARSVSVDGASVDRGPGGPGWMGWLSEPVAWRVPRGAAGLIAASLVVLVGVSFGVGQWLGKQSAVTEQQDYQAAATSLMELQAETNPTLLPPELGGVSPHNRRYAEGDGNAVGEDPRIEGLNYFSLLVVPGSAGDEIYRIADFLRDHDVDAAVVPVNNGRLKLVALPGFERPYSDPRAQELAERLKLLGRKWRSELGGSTDWADMIAERHRASAE